MLEKIDVIEYLDIIEDLVDDMSDYGYGEYDLSSWLKIVDEKDIEEALKLAHFKFKKKRKGVYDIKEEEIPEDVRKQVTNYIKECIKSKGFDEEGEIRVKLFGKFPVNPISIMQIIRDMGYIGVMEGMLGTFIVRDQDY